MRTSIRSTFGLDCPDRAIVQAHIHDSYAWFVIDKWKSHVHVYNDFGQNIVFFYCTETLFFAKRSCDPGSTSIPSRQFWDCGRWKSDSLWNFSIVGCQVTSCQSSRGYKTSWQIWYFYTFWYSLHIHIPDPCTSCRFAKISCTPISPALDLQ